MNKLLSFEPDSGVQMSGEMVLNKSLLFISYSLRENLDSVDLGGAPTKSDPVPRRDFLWKKTCFEAFLQPKFATSYFELNFSLDPAWACYEFTNYREPQPPRPSEAFLLKEFVWEPSGTLRLTLQNCSGFTEFRVGLTAIIVLKNGKKIHFALSHLGNQPDFHRSESFTLERG